MKTIRQQMMALLQQQALDRRELSQQIGIAEKEVDRHLPHIAKSAAARGMRWVLHPARCRACGHTFTKRTRLDPPGRCPTCRQSRIQGPWYRIETC